MRKEGSIDVQIDTVREIPHLIRAAITLLLGRRLLLADQQQPNDPIVLEGSLYGWMFLKLAWYVLIYGEVHVRFQWHEAVRMKV